VEELILGVCFHTFSVLNTFQITSLTFFPQSAEVRRLHSSITIHTESRLYNASELFCNCEDRSWQVTVTAVSYALEQIHEASCGSRAAPRDPRKRGRGDGRGNSTAPAVSGSDPASASLLSPGRSLAGCPRWGSGHGCQRRPGSVL